MRHPFRPLLKLSVVALVGAVTLSACSSLGLGGGAEKAAPLAGKRIDLTFRQGQLAPTPGADTTDFLLPEPQSMPNWNQSGGNGAHYPQHVALPQAVVRAWTSSTGSLWSWGRGSHPLNTPVVHSGRLFAVNGNGQVTALKAADGERLWQVTLPLAEPELARTGGGLAVQGDLLFVTTGGGQVFALTASSGKKVWDVDLAVPLRAAPAVEGSHLYIISQDNRLFALNALDGTLQWTHSGMESTLGLMNAAAPAVANGVVVAPYTSGEVFVLRATDGRFIWQDTLTSPYNGQDPEATVTAIAAAPVVADGLLYAVGLNGGLSAYGVANGQRFWKADITTTQQPWVAGLQIFALTDNGELVALNRKDGAIRWVADLNAGLEKSKDTRLWTGPILTGNRLMVASSDGFALSVNPETGKRLAVVELNEGVSVPPIAAEGRVHFFTDSGKVVTFSGK